MTWLKDKVKGKAEDEDVQRKVQIPLNMADAKSRMDSMILKKVVLEEDIKTEADPEVEVNQKFTDNEYTFMEEHLATVDVGQVLDPNDYSSLGKEIYDEM